jgi:hypothetical protein
MNVKGSCGAIWGGSETMRVLLANLKHFYQCRVLWFLYLFVAFNLLLLGGLGLRVHSFRGAAGGIEGTSFCGMGVICAVSLVVGAIVASLQMDVISKPFSFCLPDHRTILRKLVLLVSLAVSLFVLSLEFAKGSLWNPAPPYLFGVSLTAYFVGVGVGLMSRYGAAVVFSATLALLLGGAMLDLRESSGYVVTTVSAIVAILLGMGSAVAVWQWLGRTGLFRRRCGKPWLGVAGLWNPGAWEKYRWVRLSAKASRALPSRAERFLFDTMSSCRYGSAAKHVWGALYTWSLPGGGGRSRTISMGLLGLASGVVACHFPQIGPFFVANASVYGGDVLRNPPANSHLLVAGGRRERFFATMALIIVLGAIVTGGLMLGAIAADLLGIRSPMSEPYREYQESYIHAVVTQAMNLRLVVLFAALFPVSRWLEIRFLGRRVGARGTQMMLLLSAVLFGQFTLPLLAPIPPVYVAFVFLLSWVAGLYGVYRTIMRSDLVRR